MKIFKAMIAYRSVHPLVMGCQVGLAHYSLSVPHSVKVSLKNALIYDCSAKVARNKACEMAIEQGADFLLMTDDDMLVPDNLIHRLTIEVDEDTGVLAPLFYKRVMSGIGDAAILPCVFREVDDGEVTWPEPVPKQRFECAAVGAGVMLINTTVLKAMTQPWFFFEKNDRTMDVNFCREARRLGFKVECLGSLTIQQISGVMAIP